MQLIKNDQARVTKHGDQHLSDLKIRHMMDVIGRQGMLTPPRSLIPPLVQPGIGLPNSSIFICYVNSIRYQF
jgi:hypothetical protein